MILDTCTTSLNECRLEVRSFLPDVEFVESQDFSDIAFVEKLDRTRNPKQHPNYAYLVRVHERFFSKNRQDILCLKGQIALKRRYNRKKKFEN